MRTFTDNFDSPSPLWSNDRGVNGLRDGGIWVRNTDNRNGVLLVTGCLSGTGRGLYRHIVQNGDTGAILNPVDLGFPVNANVHLKIDARGSHFAVCVNGATTPATTPDVDEFQIGKIALYSFSGQSAATFGYSSRSSSQPTPIPLRATIR